MVQEKIETAHFVRQKRQTVMMAFCMKNDMVPLSFLLLDEAASRVVFVIVSGSDGWTSGNALGAS